MSQLRCVVCSAGAEKSDRFTKVIQGCGHQYCGSCLDDLLRTKRFPPLICCEDNLALEKKSLRRAKELAEEADGPYQTSSTKLERQLDKDKAAVYFKQLEGLKTASRLKVQTYTEVAKQMLQEGAGKEAVYAVAKRIVTAPDDEKAGAWCLVDSIVRNTGSKMYVKEFARHLPKLLSQFVPTCTEGRTHFLRIAERWRRDKLFPSDVLKAIKQAALQSK
eukprot:GGOE01061119.1.p1 GENE.GGOE01061119.1~~GGOE01061119.1.p1  ORF type:complete len:234 (+),score=56.18 GGOE01061119.1:48-704(+)